MLDPEYLKRALPTASLVTQMAALTVLGAFAGRWLDERLGVMPWLTLLLSSLGFGVGLWLFIRGIARTSEDDAHPPQDPP